MATDAGDGNLGCFQVPIMTKITGGRSGQRIFTVISSDQAGWEHVSVSLPDRLPTWDEMCSIKGMFWGEEDCVIQYHPPQSSYINNHPYCLHMWRPTEEHLPTPPVWMVGVKTT